jgi:predicted nucleic acid-binding protein
MSLIYLDSCIVIYLIERHPQYASIIEQALAEQHQAIIALSPLVQLEVLVKPMRDNNKQIVQLYQQFLAATRMLSITDAIFDIALDLRVRRHLKTPDALHLAIASYYDCDAFWTNDDRLASAAGALTQNIIARQP